MKNLINKILLIDNTADLDEVINAIKIARSNINRASIAAANASLGVGDTVSFTSRKHGVMTGEISKMKIKRANVTVNGTEWNVPLTMLVASCY